MGLSMSLDEPEIKSSGLKIKIKPLVAQAPTPAPAPTQGRWVGGSQPGQRNGLHGGNLGAKGHRLPFLLMRAGRGGCADQARAVSVQEHGGRGLTFISNIRGRPEYPAM